MAQPEALKVNAENSLSKIKELFKLELLQSKKYNKTTGDEVFKRKNGDLLSNGNNESKKICQTDVSLGDSVPKIDTIGTVTPVEDFKMLLEGGIQFAAIVVKMEKVIIKLLSDSLGDQFNMKIRNCVEIFRQTSVERKNSAHFNDFMSELKQTLASQKKYSLWQKLVDDKLTLISSLEDSGSNFSGADVSKFNVIETTKDVIEENDDDDDDLVSFKRMFKKKHFHFSKVILCC